MPYSFLGLRKICTNGVALEPFFRKKGSCLGCIHGHESPWINRWCCLRERVATQRGYAPKYSRVERALHGNLRGDVRRAQRVRTNAGLDGSPSRLERFFISGAGFANCRNALA